MAGGVGRGRQRWQEPAHVGTGHHREFDFHV